LKIQLRPSTLKLRRNKIKYIIIHHTSEMYKRDEAKIDNRKYQMPDIFKGVLENKDGDINYHYILEQVKEEYVPVICRPISFLCDWDDIDPNINRRSIHIGLLGNYDLKIPDKRLYEIMTFRVISPMLKLFNLSTERIKFHSEVSSNKDLTCPGEFLEKAKIISMIRKFVIK
jgi:hypothetical protein